MYKPYTQTLKGRNQASFPSARGTKDNSCVSKISAVVDVDEIEE